MVIRHTQLTILPTKQLAKLRAPSLTPKARKNGTLQVHRHSTLPQDTVRRFTEVSQKNKISPIQTKQ